MQSKKLSPTKPGLEKSNSIGKIVAPQSQGNLRNSPKKPIIRSYLAHQNAKDYFTYTPLRHNKSATCSTPDLNLNKTMRKDQQQPVILSQKKVILDQGKALQQKLKEFKNKIKSKTKSSSIGNPTIRANYSQITVFFRMLEKKIERFNEKVVKDCFFLIFNVYKKDFASPTRFYFMSLLKKSFTSLRILLTQTQIARNHYKLQLQIKSFIKWTDFISSTKSSLSIQIYDSNEAHLLNKFATEINKTSSISSASSSECFSVLVKTLYENSLKDYHGIRPWKNFISKRHYKKKQVRLAEDNYSCKLAMKGFNGLFSYYISNTRKPQKFRALYLLQHCFAALKEYDKEEDDCSEMIEVYQSYSLTSKMLDNWKIYTVIQKVLKEKELRRSKVRSRISSYMKICSKKSLDTNS